MGKTYRVHEFAELAGVTVKALQHYDRLGLLKPRRTDAGHRRYVEGDVARLEQIVALKYIGIPLKQIREVLDRDSRPLADALKLQREVLEDKRCRLDSAIRAIAEVERHIEQDGISPMSILKQLIGVIEMQGALDVMKQYYSEEAWAKVRHLYEEEPPKAWRELYDEILASVHEDPKSEHARSLLRRYGEKWRAEVGTDPGVLQGNMRAWVDRSHWPQSQRQRMTRFTDVEPILMFLGEVAWEMAASLYESTSTRFLVPHRVGESRIALFRDVDAALHDGPAGPRGRDLARRWEAMLTSESRGDAEMRAAMLNSLRSRSKWPRGVDIYVAGLYMMPPERWHQAVDFLEQAWEAHWR